MFAKPTYVPCSYHFCLLLLTIIDDPHASRETHPRGFPRPPRHPTGGGGASRFPAMEGYAFITLDTTMGEMADPSSVCYNFFFILWVSRKYANFLLRLDFF